MRKPNFFIIGAPKCGTSSVFKWLSDSHQVYTSLKKEPMFFNTDMVRRIKNLNDYEDLFSKVQNNHRAVGEASTWYLFSKNAVPNILQYSDNPKFIVCLRNPIEMAPSLHWHCYRNNYEVEKDFEKAWSLQDKRSEGDSVPESCFDPFYLQYGPACRLGDQLERLYSVTERKNIITILLEDLASNPSKQYKNLLRFLDLDYNFKTEFNVENYAYRSRYQIINELISIMSKLKNVMPIKRRFGILDRISKKNRVPYERPNINFGTKKMLLQYFENDIKKLEGLLNRDLKHWTEIN